MKLLISAAEASGDRLAAELLDALRTLEPGLVAAGLAGPALRRAGVTPVARMEDVAVMGLVEVLGHMGSIRRAQAALRVALAKGDVDALVVVDAPDLHLPLAATARAAGVPVIGYVSPQVWAWRPSRIPKIVSHLDALLCLFEFEPPLYAKAAAGSGCDVRFVGHPVRDRVGRVPTSSPPVVALLPGSRRQEIQRHLPVFLDTAARLHVDHPDWRFRLVAPAGTDLPELPSHVELHTDIAAVAGSRAALSKSGTVTLELACMGVPMVVAHRVHPVTYALGKRLVTGVKHIALPNVLAGREVVPEVIQHLDAADLARRVAALPPRQATNLSALGPGGASLRAAEAVREHLRG